MYTLKRLLAMISGSPPSYFNKYRHLTPRVRGLGTFQMRPSLYVFPYVTTRTPYEPFTATTRTPRRTRGALVVFEGVDRSGKSTQAQFLVDTLNGMGRPAQRMTFPNRSTPTGQLIDTCLKKDLTLPGEVLHLLFSANRWEMKAELEHLLDQGVTVVLDRYVHSGIVYSVAAHNLSKEWCEASDKGLPTPDLVILLDLQSGSERDGYGNELYEQDEIQQKTRTLFRTLAANENWVVMDAQQPKEEIASKIYHQVMTKLKMYP
jgi:dTMP kinase